MHLLHAERGGVGWISAERGERCGGERKKDGSSARWSGEPCEQEAVLVVVVMEDVIRLAEGKEQEMKE